ncbi:hypothetical protein LNQ03_09195 [Klebsiella pneumoniae subsp. pneumoniae]|nr:hypothetical protein [Klebsiella pneumoniae subsp. pneumoniae]
MPRNWTELIGLSNSLLSSGYVFLGDYEDGPFQFSARNQYIRYNNQYYRLNAATDVGFTTTGTDATSFCERRYSLRSDGW